MQSDVRVRDIMSREYVGVSESDRVEDVVGVLLDDGATAAAVVRGCRPVGVVTTHDLLTAVHRASDVTVGDLMDDPEPVTDPDRPFVDALDQMSTQGTKRLLVTDGDELIGMLTAEDALTAATSLLENGASGESGKRILGATEVSAAEEAGETPRAETEYSSQSVCESCGTLTRDLQNFNGQLICSDCRDV